MRSDKYKPPAITSTCDLLATRDQRGGRSTLPLSIRRWALGDADGRCDRCGCKLKAGDVDFHHLIPVADGGTNHPDNIRPLCSSCHHEWTFHIEGLVSYEVWCDIPPASFLVQVFSLYWTMPRTAFDLQDDLRLAWRICQRRRDKEDYEQMDATLRGRWEPAKADASAVSADGDSD